MFYLDVGVVLVSVNISDGAHKDSPSQASEKDSSFDCAVSRRTVKIEFDVYDSAHGEPVESSIPSLWGSKDWNSGRME
jgi:hypothetical protein